MPQAHAANRYFDIIIIDTKVIYHIFKQIYKCLEYISDNIAKDYL